MSHAVFVHGYFRKTPNGKMVHVREHWRVIRDKAGTSGQVDENVRDDYDDRVWNLKYNTDELYDNSNELLDNLKEKLESMGIEADASDDMFDEVSTFIDNDLDDLYWKVDSFPEHAYLPTELEQLEKKYSELKKEYEDLAESVEEYKGYTDKKAEPWEAGTWWEKRAVAEWGLTSMYQHAGYILSDGSMLNMGCCGVRGQDHREVGTFMDEADDNWGDYCPGVYQSSWGGSTGYMLCFMKRTGAIRLSVDNDMRSFRADILKGQNITWRQRETLQGLFGKEALLDITDPETASGEDTIDVGYFDDRAMDEWESKAR